MIRFIRWPALIALGGVGLLAVVLGYLSVTLTTRVVPDQGGVYVEGVAGELFGSLSLAVAFSLMASLLVALTLLPALAARWGAGKGGPLGAPAQGSDWKSLGRLGKVLRVLRWVALSPFLLLGFLWSLVKQLGRFWGEVAGGLASRVFGPFLNAFDRWFDTFARRYHEVLDWSLDNTASSEPRPAPLMARATDAASNARPNS